jgi:hypothetical protein
VVPFEPGEQVLMYTCGITPYDATHLGHAATFITYDVLQRRLIDRGHTVKCVRNVTDVDDPLFAKARELGVHYLDLAAGEEARFERDMEALNALPVYSSPRASSPPSPTSAGSSAWCSTGVRLRGRRQRVLRRLEVPVVRLHQPLLTREMLEFARSAAATSTTQQARPARLRAVAPVGCPTSPAGTPCGAPAARAGTSSAARWRCASWAPPSTCTAAAAT